jgi:hypothetical protein
MIAVIVQRQPSDKPGPDITEALLASEEAARERGRVEIDRNSTGRVMVTVSGPHRRFVSPGTLVQYHGRRGSWVGLIRRCAITLSREGDSFTADRSLEIEREP